MERRGFILDLGLIDYQKAWELQHRFWARRVNNEIPDLLLILEHPHVITLGRRGDRSHLLVSSEVLEVLKIPLFHVERGGDVTYHGPGQLVVYPILDLKDYGYRLLRYIDLLIEEVIIRTLKDFGIEAGGDSSNRGVWVRGEKIASIGVTVKQWVSFHGFSLNYETDLKYFELIHPCGLEGVKMTSIKKILGEKVSRERLVERMVSHFKEIFKKRWEMVTIEEILNLREDI